MQVLPSNGKVRVAYRRAARALDAGAGPHSFQQHANRVAEGFRGRIYTDQVTLCRFADMGVPGAILPFS